ncbi:MAG: hypothetical protein DME26_19160, partial [Verrucomicrobia bacterium]
MRLNRQLLWLCAIILLLAQAQGAEIPHAGVPRARIVIVHDPAAMAAFNPSWEKVQALVDQGITNFTGRPTVAEAWRSLVSTQDTVGIKVFSSAGPNSGTRPAVVAGVVTGLLKAGVPPRQILIWDRQWDDLNAAGFVKLADRYGIRANASAKAGYDETNAYESPLLGQLVWGDLEFMRKGEGMGRKSFVTKLVTKEITKIINITPLLNHNSAGVSGNLYGLAMGSVDNTLRFESSADRLATAVPEIYALPVLGDRVVLNIVDALICQYHGEHSRLHYSTALNELRFGTDPVALDVLSLQELNRQRERLKVPIVTNSFKLYYNGALLELGVSDFN